MPKYYIKGLAFGDKRTTTHCSCEFCEGHTKIDTTEFWADGLVEADDIEAAKNMVLTKSKAGIGKSWRDEPIAYEVSPFEVIRTAKEELDALQKWQAATKATIGQ